MIVVSIWLESGCKFEDKEYKITVDGIIHDTLDLDRDPGLIEDCIGEYDGKIKEEVLYTFFLHRANISASHPHYDLAFDIQQVIENIHKINIKL